jgi:hypothetical protein
VPLGDQNSIHKPHKAAGGNVVDNDNELQNEQISSTHKNSRGIPWSDVPLRDLPDYIRDGIEAAALLKAIEDEARS